jgi:ribose 5-phosphate isomerase A
MDLKRMAGEKAVEYVKSGMIVGLGTGSTVFYTISLLGDLVREKKLDIKGIPTSISTEKLAREVGIPLTNLKEHPEIDITIDGADEIDKNLNLIKGLGGALLREKIVASNSRYEIIVADSSKEVEKLGSKAPVPVEVLPFGWNTCKTKLEKLGCKATLRGGEKYPFVTDNACYILDCKFDKIEDARELDMKIKEIPGVFETGLFVGLAHLAIIGTTEGIKIRKK